MIKRQTTDHMSRAALATATYIVSLTCIHSGVAAIYGSKWIGQSTIAHMLVNLYFVSSLVLFGASARLIKGEKSNLAKIGLALSVGAFIYMGYLYDAIK